MTMIEEGFFQLVRRAILHGTEPCQICGGGKAPGICVACSGHKKCHSCDGVGWHGYAGSDFIVDPDGEAIETPGRSTPKIPCGLCGGGGLCLSCEGEGLCRGCDGVGQHVPHEYSEGVMAGVLSSVVVESVRARDVERFASMNQLLDVAAQWVLRGNKLWVEQATDEEKEEFAQRLRGVVESGGACLDQPDTNAPPEPSNNALTEDELRELGVLENDDD